MSKESRELLQWFRCKQELLSTKLSLEPLPKQRNRILFLSWSDTPLVYDQPRFGALELLFEDNHRSGWQVNLSRDLRNAPTHVMDWVLWREALLSFLLPHIRHIPETADLGLYAGIIFGGFSSTQKDALNTLWKQVAPPQHYQHHIYDAPIGFPLFDQVVNGTLLGRAIHWLNTLRPTTTGTPITTETYTAALERWMLETHTPLTKSEHRILTALTQLDTPLHQARLAEQLDMTISGLSQHLTKLAKRYLLRIFNSINLPLIGLVPFELIFKTSNIEQVMRINQSFTEFPYVNSTHEIQDNMHRYRLFVPHNKVDSFKKWVNDILAHEDIQSSLIVRDSEIFLNWNFTSYLPEIGWANDFALILNHIQLSIESFMEQKFSQLKTLEYSYHLLETSRRYPIHLRSDDFTYFRRSTDIIQITDRISSQSSQELREAGISETAHMKYRRRVKKLEKMQISKPLGTVLLHIGLNTVFHIMVFEPREITEHIFKALQILPFINGAFLENGNGYCFAYTPNQNAVEVLSVLRKSFAVNEIDAQIRASPSWKSQTGFQSPIISTNYDFKKNEWKWNSPSII